MFTKKKICFQKLICYSLNLMFSVFFMFFNKQKKKKKKTENQMCSFSLSTYLFYIFLTLFPVLKKQEKHRKYVFRFIKENTKTLYSKNILLVFFKFSKTTLKNSF